MTGRWIVAGLIVIAALAYCRVLHRGSQSNSTTPHQHHRTYAYCPAPHSCSHTHTHTYTHSCTPGHFPMDGGEPRHL